MCEYSKQSNIRLDSTRLDSIIGIANFQTCEYSNVSNYIPKKSGKNRNPRNMKKKFPKILRNPPKNPNLFADSYKTLTNVFQHRIIANVTPSILNHNDNNDRIKNIRTRLESNCKLSIRLVEYESNT